MIKRHAVAASLLAALTLSACVDLEVTNPNDPDAGRALSTPGDVESLIAGSYGTWWLTNGSNAGMSPILNTVSYAHSATAANFGMVEFSGYPKVAVHENPIKVYYGNFQYSWVRFYRAVSAVVDGLVAIDNGNVKLDAASAARAQAYGYFVLGLSHASAALMYDKAYVFDPTISRDEVKLLPYGEVMDAAMGYFDKAIEHASGATFTIPAAWISKDMSSADLVKLAYSYKARYRANLARTPAERAAVDWDKVIADVDRGVTATWDINMATSSAFSSSTLTNLHRFGPWGQLTYQVLGMADKSGNYQKWMAKAPADRHPNLSTDQTSDPFLILTPDKRFPQGTTVTTQRGRANAGTLFEMPTQSGGVGAQWNRPDRGTFRWSHYRFWANDAWLSARGNYPEIPIAEMRLLKAEGLLRKGDRAGAAALVNVSRTAAGLNATDAAGTNTSCVPKLPNGQCGDLMEMLKWESRLETMYKGLHHASWYFNGRGWGDLSEGVFLHLPMPGGEAQLLGMQMYTFGGIGGEAAAPKGTYGY